MGLFFNAKKYEDILPIVLPNVSKDNYSKLSEKQILGAISLYLENSQRILNDSVPLVNNTENLDVFFKRYDMLIEILYSWTIIAKCAPTYIKEGNPEKDYQNLLNIKSKAQKNALDRYLSKEKKGISLLTTQKGKDQRFAKTIDYLLNNIEKFTSDNQKYINEIISIKSIKES